MYLTECKWLQFFISLPLSTQTNTPNSNAIPMYQHVVTSSWELFRVSGVIKNYITCFHIYMCETLTYFALNEEANTYNIQGSKYLQHTINTLHYRGNDYFFNFKHAKNLSKFLKYYSQFNVLNFMGLSLYKGVLTGCIAPMVICWAMKVTTTCLTMIGHLSDTTTVNITW